MQILYTIFAVLTAMVSWNLYHSILNAIACFLFSPIAWIIWLVNHTVTLSVLKNTFAWFFV